MSSFAIVQCIGGDNLKLMEFSFDWLVHTTGKIKYMLSRLAGLNCEVGYSQFKQDVSKPIYFIYYVNRARWHHNFFTCCNIEKLKKSLVMSIDGGQAIVCTINLKFHHYRHHHHHHHLLLILSSLSLFDFFLSLRYYFCGSYFLFLSLLIIIIIIITLHRKHTIFYLMNTSYSTIRR